jgi:hypothetical protein
MKGSSFERKDVDPVCPVLVKQLIMSTIHSTAWTADSYSVQVTLWVYHLHHKSLPTDDDLRHKRTSSHLTIYLSYIPFNIILLFM